MLFLCWEKASNIKRVRSDHLRENYAGLSLQYNQKLIADIQFAGKGQHLIVISAKDALHTGKNIKGIRTIARFHIHRVL